MARNLSVRLPGGLINIPVKAEAALNPAIVMSNACDGNGEHELTAVKQQVACPVCENTDRDSFVKAIKHGKELHRVDPDSLDADKPSDDEKAYLEIKVHDALDVSRQTLPTGKSYHLVPQAKAPSADQLYGLLRGLIIDLQYENKVIVGTWAYAKIGMYSLSISEDGVIIMTGLAWPEDVRHPAAPTTDVNEDHLKMVRALVEPITTEFDPAEYRNPRVAPALLGEEPAAKPAPKKKQDDLGDLLAAALKVS